MEPEEALHWHILRRKKDGVEEWIDRSVEKIGAVPTLNEVLLPAMKEVGDKFGAGELILPFVLQSAEVMKRAVAQLENYLDRIEGHTKGKVVIATVFGDVHDIGKSLVNTILTNNGYTVDRPRQAGPDRHDHRRRGRARGRRDRPLGAARLDLEADAGLHPGAAPARARVPGADRRRRDQPRLRPPHALPARQGVRRGLRAGRLLLQGRLRRASTRWTRWSTRRRARRWSRKIRDEAQELREKPVGRRRLRRRPPTTRVRSAVAHRQRRSPSRRSGACARSTSTSTRSSPTSTATCSSSCTGAAAARRARTGGGSSRATTTRRASRRSSSGCGASRTTCTRGPGSATSPATPTATSWSSSTPRTPTASSSGSSSRASPSTTGSAWPTSTGRSTRGERDVVALQGGHGRRPRSPSGSNELEREGEFAEQLFVHGLGVQAAEGLAEWLHAEVRRELGDRARPGPPLLVGLPGLPGPVRAREGLAPARPRGDRDDALRRLRGRARAVDGGDRRPPPAGGLLRDEVRLHPRGEEGATS